MSAPAQPTNTQQEDIMPKPTTPQTPLATEVILTPEQALYGLILTVRANAQARPDRYMAEELLYASLDAADAALAAAQVVAK